MRQRQLHKVLCFAILLWSSMAISSDGVTQDEALRLRQADKILPLEKIITRAQTQHRGTILEAELYKKAKGYVYEIEILDANGIVWEMKFNARNGKLLSTKEDD